MIKIIKTTPITLDGEDCLEVLLEDSHFTGLDNCNACIYRDVEFDFELGVSCCEIHNCIPHTSTRFIRLPLDSNLPNLNLQ